MVIIAPFSHYGQPELSFWRIIKEEIWSISVFSQALLKEKESKEKKSPICHDVKVSFFSSKLFSTALLDLEWHHLAT